MKTYIKRKIDTDLIEWKNSEFLKPLLIRGARQVGKSTAVRAFSKLFKFYVEINLDESPEIISLFDRHSDVTALIQELEVLYNVPIISGETLVFIDEVQASNSAIRFLRYFYEKYPQLHVIAAGSLLEFALDDLPSFGVGRIRSLFVYPLSFTEFLRAINEDRLANFIQASVSERTEMSILLHKKATQLLNKFILIGGMPQVVSSYVQSANLLECQRLLDDLVVSYADDFVKFSKKVLVDSVRSVFAAVAQQLGQKFNHSKGLVELNSGQVKNCLSLLERAGLIYAVTHSSSNGVPLAAEMNPKFKKYLIFDTGIFQRMLQLNLSELLIKEDGLIQINKGALAELHVGLELIKNAPNNSKHELFYWQRESKGSQAEVDYVVQRNHSVIPIEVKSGSRGSMQSLHLFQTEKNAERGIRCSLERFSTYEKIEVYPLYAAGLI